MVSIDRLCFIYKKFDTVLTKSEILPLILNELVKFLSYPHYENYRVFDNSVQ